jgi:DNA mismatch endonuclease (patch repair protein)
MCSEFTFRDTSDLRRANMRAIKSRRNKTTEKRLRAHIVASGVSGWRMHSSELSGCPDFFFYRARVAVFVDGCFWHGCPRCGHVPKTNRSYWLKKLKRNRQRDKRIGIVLKLKGIRVLRIWECDLRSQPLSCLKRILKLLESTLGVRKVASRPRIST